MNETHVLASELQRRERLVRLGDKRLEFARCDLQRMRICGRRGMRGANQGASAPGYQREHSAGCCRRRESNVAGRLRRHDVHCLQQRIGPLDAEERHHFSGARAGRVDGELCADCQFALTHEVLRNHPADPSAVFDRRDRFDVVREVGARQVRRGGEGDRQPLALDDLVVVPLRAAGQILRFDSGEQPKGGRLGNQLGAGQMQFRLDAVVAVSAEPGIDSERRAQRHSALDRGSIGADEKRQRAQEPGRNPAERAAFVNRFARPIQSR